MSNGLIFAGDLYMDRIVAGAKTGRLLFGNVPNLSIIENVTQIVRTSYQRDSRGSALETHGDRQPAVLNLTSDEFNTQILSIVLLGDTVNVTQASGSITDESVVVRHGAWVKLASEQVSNVVVTEDQEVAPVTYVLGTDYEINARLGMIRALAGGAITDGQTVILAYDAAAVTKERIRGGLMPSGVPAELFLDGINVRTGQAIHLTVPRASLFPNGEIALLNGETSFQQFQATATIERVIGETADYYLDLVANPA